MKSFLSSKTRIRKKTCGSNQNRFLAASSFLDFHSTVLSRVYFCLRYTDSVSPPTIKTYFFLQQMSNVHKTKVEKDVFSTFYKNTKNPFQVLSTLSSSYRIEIVINLNGHSGGGEFWLILVIQNSTKFLRTVIVFTYSQKRRLCFLC